MFKKELAPGVMLYRPGYNLGDPLLEDIKSPGIHLSNFYTDSWRNWGNHEGFRKAHINLQQIQDSLDQYPELQNMGPYMDFFDLYKHIASLYLNDIKDLNILKPYINYDIKAKEWIVGQSMLQLQTHKSKEYSDSRGGMAFGLHFDINDSNIEPGVKNIFTGNLYLNDDYEGGEIVFVFPSDLNNLDDIENFKSITYKPKKGDFVFYPADWPVTHGVRFAFNSDRYLIICTTKWQYDGSMGESLNSYILHDPVLLKYIDTSIKEENKQYIDGRQL